MAESTPTSSDAPVPGATSPLVDALRRHRRPLSTALGLCAATLVAALAIPVRTPDAAGPDARGTLGGAPITLAAAEDLAAFNASRRWGGETIDDFEARRRAEQDAANSHATRRDRMGFVGTSATPDDRIVLLTLPGGEVRRIPAGSRLPDGRTVSDVTDTTATLSDTVSGDVQMQLFPRPLAETDGADADSTSDAVSQRR